MDRSQILEFAKSKLIKASGEELQFYKSVIKEMVKLDNTEVEEAFNSNSVYMQCVELYRQFLEKKGIPMMMDGVQGKALKNIMMKLKRASKSKNNDGIVQSWDFILTHWDRTGDFIGRQKSLVRINSNLTEILDKIRNGASKKHSASNQAQQLDIELELRRQKRAGQSGQA